MTQTASFRCAAHHAVLGRLEQAGAVLVTALRLLLEFEHDWARGEHCDEMMVIVKTHAELTGWVAKHAITKSAARTLQYWN